MSDQKRLSHNPFAALGPLKKTGPEAAVPPATTPPVETPVAEPRQKSVARAVVRLERTGRGGKEVTVIDHLALNNVELERWLKAFKTALGCGGIVEDDRLVLQGDQRDRVRRLLTERGVKKIAG
jgi:translation initiation factor 1